MKPPTFDQLVTTDDKPWSITWRGRTWRRSDMTVEHARIIGEFLGTDTWTWHALHPARGPLHLVAVVVACLCVDGNIRTPEGVAVVVDLFDPFTIDELRQALRVE